MEQVTEQYAPPDPDDDPPVSPLARPDSLWFAYGGGRERYPTDRTGLGRWFVLEVPMGRPVATIYTDDSTILGFLPHWEERWDYSDLIVGWSEAYANGAAVTQVFEAMANTVSQGRFAGPIQSGDLSSLVG